MFPKNKKAHYANVVALGCMISGGPATIHHAHGRSVGARLVTLGMDGGNGVALRGFSDALIIPLAGRYHNGGQGVDTIGVEYWEGVFGDQPTFIDQVSERVGYSLWELHRAWCPPSKILPRR